MALVLVAATLLAAGCVRLPPPPVEPIAATCRLGPPVAWIEPDDRRQRAALARWCATVGPVVWERPSPSASGAADSLAVITWNIHAGGGDVDALVRRLRAGAFTDGEPVHHFILLLQEALRSDETLPRLASGSGTPRRIGRHVSGGDVRRLATEHGLSLLYAPSMRNGHALPAEDRGNAVAATLPIENPTVIELPFAHQRRVATAGTVTGTRRDGTPWRLRVVSAHFDTAPLAEHGPFETRRRQAEALIDAMSSPEPTIVAGDFNAWLGEREPAIAELRRAFPLLAGRFRESTWRGPLWTRATLDYLFARGDIPPPRVRRLTERFGSDHYPLLAVVEIQPSRARHGLTQPRPQD